MKVLFLDVDGVLNHEQTFIEARKAFEAGEETHIPFVVDPNCCNEVLRVLQETGAKLVLSTAGWRYSDGVERLKAVGVITDNNLHRDPITKRFSGMRGHEIKDWLNRNPVERYAIVDDDSDMLDEQMPYFVKTSFENSGLTRECADKLISILNAVHAANDG